MFCLSKTNKTRWYVANLKVYKNKIMDDMNDLSCRRWGGVELMMMGFEFDSDYGDAADTTTCGKQNPDIMPHCYVYKFKQTKSSGVDFPKYYWLAMHFMRNLFSNDPILWWMEITLLSNYPTKSRSERLNNYNNMGWGMVNAKHWQHTLALVFQRITPTFFSCLRAQ